jgi:chromosome segregation ATPase
MSFSHSDGNHFPEDGMEEEFLVQKMQKKFEMRITKLTTSITMHVEEKNTLAEEIVMWKKKHLEEQETNRDLHVEIKRLRMKIEEYAELQEMDADEDAMREHQLSKTRKHLKELDIKYHALKKDYDALLHMQVKFHEMEEQIVILTGKCKHWESDCHMWEEKFHKMEAKYHDCYGKISIHMKTIKEYKIIIDGHGPKIHELEERIRFLDMEMHRWEKECHGWEEKHGLLMVKIVDLERQLTGHDVIIIEWTNKCKDLETRCHYLSEEMHKWEKECHGW